MPGATGTILFKCTSGTEDADFRNWINELRALWTAMGLVQTADTGQLDPATVLYSETAAFNNGGPFEVWRMDDANQTNAPIFLRIVYGKGSNFNALRLFIQAGTGTDGAGALTDSDYNASGCVIMNSQTNGSPNVNKPYAWSAGDGWFWFWIGRGVSEQTLPGGIAVFRHVNASNEPTDYGWQAEGFYQVSMRCNGMVIAGFDGAGGLLGSQAVSTIGNHAMAHPLTPLLLFENTLDAQTTLAGDRIVNSGTLHVHGQVPIPHPGIVCLNRNQFASAPFFAEADVGYGLHEFWVPEDGGYVHGFTATGVTLGFRWNDAVA